MEEERIPRSALSVEVTPEVKDALARLLARTGMPKREFLARLILWFGTQVPTVQQVILGTLPPESAPDVARLVLTRLGYGEEAERAIVEKAYGVSRARKPSTAS